jgi:hypothetical protein
LLKASYGALLVDVAGDEEEYSEQEDFEALISLVWLKELEDYLQSPQAITVDT